MSARRQALRGLLLCCFGVNLARASSQLPVPLPDLNVAGRDPNAFNIFNAVHSALRQWGSSVHHNGMSFFPVTIPEGNIFYHGTHSTERPSRFEWLAFELEHASQFAVSIESTDRDISGKPPASDHDAAHGRPNVLSLHGRVSKVQSQSSYQHIIPGADLQVPLLRGEIKHRATTQNGSFDDLWPPATRGYLHTYRAARPLKLVYIDGMAAAKCQLGTLDSQDYVLLGHSTEVPGSGWNGEAQRAEDLCKLAREWEVDGWIRMEAGFEIIYCDFSEGAGLDLLSVRGSPFRNETGSVTDGHYNEWLVMGTFEWLRAAATRYHGLPRGRAQIDFSGMVSGFAYDINITNPDLSRQDVPRLVNSTREQRLAIKDRLWEVLQARENKASNSVDWQAIVDIIVARFSDRLRFLAEGPISALYLRSELATLLYPFLDFPEDKDSRNSTKPVLRCTDHYFSSATERKASWTPEDRAIFAAVRVVSNTICHDLLKMREIALNTSGTSQGDDEAAQRVQVMAKELVTRLGWTTWKHCGGCSEPDQMCHIAMFPFGDVEDHFSPRCKIQDEIDTGYFVPRHALDPNARASSQQL